MTTEPWLKDDNPFNYSATGFLGKKRADMLSNPILHRTRLGVKNYSELNFSPDKVFGNNYRDQWGSAHALRGWAGTFPPVKQKVKKPLIKPPKDFLQLNVSSATAATVTSSEVRSYRKTKRIIRLRIGTIMNKKLERPLPKLLKPTDVFGRPNLHTDTIQDLLAHNYQKQYLSGAKQGEVEIRKKKTIDFTKVRPTRKTALCPQVIPTGVLSQPWRNPRFLSKAEPRLSTFRSDTEMYRAYEAYAFESAGREGQTGQGIPKNTPHEHPPVPLKDPELCERLC